uniref:Uncharacterized protein n=1 Tax=Tanacetum cinerariifolium TaxID=118510 RepID=A0A6L2MQ35_TANCI|nr:hypothetical protein [Tanacetum cinerariifolium]
MPPKPGLSYIGLDEFAVKPVVENKSSEKETKAVRKNTDALIIEEWMSDDEEENVTQPKIVKKIVRPNIVKKDFIIPRQQEKTSRKTIKKVKHNRKNTHRSRGNQRNWNNMMSQKLGKHVADEAVYKELDDKLVRAATTASSLEAEHDSGNIDKTQSKVTPNEASSSGTTSGGGPRVLALKKTKPTQALEITSLKRRVKKLKKKQRSRTHKVKRLYNVGLKARVDSSKDDQSLGEDASKQRRKINEIDADEYITLVNDQDDAEMFDVNDLHVEDINTAKLIVNDAQVSAAGEVNAASIATTVSAAATITTVEITLAQALVEIKTSKPKAKGVVIQEPSKSITTTTTTTTISLKKSQDKEMRIKFFVAKAAEEKRNKPPTQAQQIKIMCTYLKNMEWKKLKNLKNKSFDSIQKMSDRAFNRVNTFVDFKTELVEGSSKRTEEELTQGNSKKQKVDNNKEIVELKELMKIIYDEEEIAIDVIPLAVKSLKIIDWKIHKEGKKTYYQIIRADRNSKMYMVFNKMLKEFDREDLEDLYTLVKAKYGSTKPLEDLDLLL